MRRTLLMLLLVALVGAAVWYGVVRKDEGSRPAAAQPPAEAAYDFEAQGVVMRQMDAQGRLQYEIVARRIVQLPGNGQVVASGLTLRHDPPGTEEGSPRRWVLTAASGELPAQGRVVDLSGDVQARGLPEGSQTPVQLSTDRLRYDMSTQEASTDGEVEISSGQHVIRGRGLKVNIATGTLALESVVHGTIPL